MWISCSVHLLDGFSPLFFIYLLNTAIQHKKKVFRKVIYIYIYIKKRCGRGTTNWLRGLCCPQRGLATRTHYFVSESPILSLFFFFQRSFGLLWLRLGITFSGSLAVDLTDGHPTWTFAREAVRSVLLQQSVEVNIFFSLFTLFNNLLICAS